MAPRPHLKLDTKKQADKPKTLKFNYGFPTEEERKKEEPDYRMMAANFSRCLQNLDRDLRTRELERNPGLQVPDHIDYIEILFQSQFDLKNYYEAWFKEFGLLGIKFSKFSHVVLFAVSDRALFNEFIKNIETFIQKEGSEQTTGAYSGKIKYVKEFKLLSTPDILQYERHTELMNLLLTNFPLSDSTEQTIRKSLFEYLDRQGIRSRFFEETDHLELYGSSNEQIVDIVKNFDVVLSVTSSLSTVVGPSPLNVAEKTYGFEIENSTDDLPLIAIVDTGISDATPLTSVLVKDAGYNLTSSSPFIDTANGGSGHGTGVAALASLGRAAYEKKYRGNLTADAKLLSIKILDNNTGYLSEKDIVDLLIKAKKQYPSLKLFVLTTCYQVHKGINSDFSTYAFELDKFSHENDCLIFICTANNDAAADHNRSYDLNYFLTEHTNLCAPAESMNNVVVGAAADSLSGGSFTGISSSKEFPTIFTRKGHADLARLFPKNKTNRFYFRPDIIECGGDYEFTNGFIGQGTSATMEILSANASEGFCRQAGTSYSTPLVANIAAKLQRLYPSIRSQSIKALIVNGASLEIIRFPAQLDMLVNKTAGYGLVMPDKTIFSNDNTITFVIEDDIEPETVKIIPINFPGYLSGANIGKKNGVVWITMTLCFSFHPVFNNQLAYCPVHIAFGLFKNQTAEEILAKEENFSSKLKSGSGWSQRGRDISKPVPYSNTQKMSFPINVDELVNESNTFKLGLNCRICPQLFPGADNPYKIPHLFSMAITIEENYNKKEYNGHLYEELEAVNFTENIARVTLEGEAEV